MLGQKSLTRKHHAVGLVGLVGDQESPDGYAPLAHKIGFIGHEALLNKFRIIHEARQITDEGNQIKLHP